MPNPMTLILLIKMKNILKKFINNYEDPYCLETNNTNKEYRQYVLTQLLVYFSKKKFIRSGS